MAEAFLLFLRKFWSHLGLLAVMVMLFFTRSALDDAKTKDQEFREGLQRQLKLKSAKAPDITFGVQTALDEREACKSLQEQISAAAADAHERSTRADTELARKQTDNTRKFVAAQPKLRELQTRQPTGLPAEDAEIIARDSEAPWKGWK